MAVKQHSGGVDFGLLLMRLTLGAYVGLAGLGKLGIFSVKAGESGSAAATQATQAADAGEPALPTVSFQWPGFGDLLDNTVNFVNGSVVGMAPPWLPETLASIYGYAIPFAEVLFGALLIIGLLTRLVSLLSLLMIGSFTIALAGEHFVNLFQHGPGPFSANFIYLAVLLALLFAGAGRVSIDRLIGGGTARESEENEDYEADVPHQF